MALKRIAVLLLCAGPMVWPANFFAAEGNADVPAKETAIASTEFPIQPAPGKPESLPTLTTVREVSELPPERAAWKYPVALRGVVTVNTRIGTGFFVQDGTSGIFIQTETTWPNLKPGDLVEITGVSDPSSYAPMVIASNVTVVGAAALPEPLPMTLFQLATGQRGSQWIEVYGVVRSLSYSNGLAELELNDPSGTLPIYIPATSEVTNLLDAVVRIRGACASGANARRQLTSLRMWATSLDFVRVEEFGAADPLNQPVRPIVSLSQFRPRATLQRRINVSGVVTLCLPDHSFFIQDNSDGVQVFSPQVHDVKPGDRVKVAGYPTFADFGSALHDSVVQILEHGSLPQPKHVAQVNAIDPQLHGRWIQLDARLLSRSSVDNMEVLTLGFDDRVFEAHRLLAQADTQPIRNGSLVRLTGVYRVLADEARSPVSFQLLVPADEPVQIMENPPWWNGRKVLTVFGVMSAILLGAALWVVTLRRRVQKQTALIRKRLEREADIEQNYRELFDSAHDLIYTQDLEGRITSINPAGLRILGFTREELNQLSIDDVAAPEYRERFRRLRQPTEHSQGAHVCELEFISRSGNRVIVEASSRLIFKDGNPDGVQVIARDITERKHIEMALAQTSGLLEVLLNNSPDLIYFKDLRSRFIRYSRSMAEFFHATDLESLKGKTDFDFFTKDHAQAAFDDEQEIIRTGRAIVGKLENEVHTDGRHTWGLTTKLPWRDKDGKIIGTFGISKDVTTIKEAELKLAYEQELFQALIDNFPDVIYFKDLQSRFVRVSRSKAEKSMEVLLAQYRATHPQVKDEELPAHLKSAEAFGEYLIGKTDFDTFTEERARAAFEDEQQIIRTGQPVIAKVERTPQLDGSIAWHISTKIPWRDRNGNIIGTFGVSKDITELKKAEEALETTHKRLLETSRLAGMAEVATDVLHNVGNVLNSINVSSSLVVDRLKQSKLTNLPKVTALLDKNRERIGEFLANDPQGKRLPEYLSALAECFSEEQADTLNELEGLRKNIDHIKQIVAMQQNYAKVAGVVERLTAKQLLEDALHINEAALIRHGVHVECKIEDESLILTDKHKVLQILVNLIRNAKYALHESDQTNKRVLITVHGEPNGGVRIQVIDNGMGIKPENLARIFGHGFTTRPDGHGFGLHSSALAARDLGGSLSAESDGPGKGATFTLVLPRELPSSEIAKAA